MWHQQHSTSSHIDDSTFVSDCSAQHNTPRYPHGIPTHTEVSYSDKQSQWKSGKGQQEVSVNRELSSPSCTKGYSDSGNLYDSSRTDSGFLSGANLVSEQCVSDEISTSRKSQDSTLQDPPVESKEVSKDDMRLDSGVDVGLSDNFLSLSIANSPLNDLNVSPSKLQSQDLSVPNITLPQHSFNTQSQQYEESQHISHFQLQNNSPPTLEKYFQQDEDGDTQLHIAITQGFIEVVYSLTLMAPHSCFLDIQNYKYEQAPLHLAVLTHQPRIVRRLLVAGATVDTRDRSGNTPLHLACHNGDLECVRALTEPITVTETHTVHLQYTAYQQQVPQNLEERNYDGQTCVHLAAMNGHVDVLRHLLWFGANINAREAKGGRTVLHYAVELGLASVLRFLLEECTVQLETPTYAGHTAYQLALCIDTTLAHQLTEHGAHPKVLPDDSESDSDFDDDSDEMYEKTDDNFSSLRLNGQPIDITA